MDNTDLIVSFKELMKITHSAEDLYISQLLSRSASAIARVTGAPDVLVLDATRELVLERARYAYNEALEYFDDNFLGAILGAQLEVTLASEPLEPPGRDDLLGGRTYEP